VAALAAAARPANAQAPQGQSPVPTPQPRFGFEDVVRRARELAAVPYDPAALALPEPLARLDFDAWRDIRFRPERALFQQTPFQLQTFHPGFLHTRPVVVNVIREGVPAPIPYAANLFDYGRNRFERPLPVTTGFAGFRLHHPLNRPTYQDELISFLGASYFRFLGRSQQYGLSARGLAIGVGARETEEFPYFREFWVETPDAQADRAVVYALLDGESVTGAYQFLIYPGRETVLDITATVLARRSIGRLGVAPLTSMFFVGETERRAVDDFRPEMHDSDGLLIHSGSGEWIWRPLRNPRQTEVSSFLENNVRGFGLMQRDRIFEHYQDLDLAYERRPSYWVEPIDGWGEGRIELHEIPTSDETNDNIVALWTPREPMAAGQSRTFKYRLISTSDESRLTPGGIALNTFRTRARALGSAEAEAPNSTRFLVDFVGGQLPFFESAPDHVQVVPSASNGRVLRTFLVWNAKTRGFRAGIDVQVDPGQAADLRAFLRAGNKALTETWTYPWRPE
jgi:glucans biosynthesis protein